MTPRAAGFLTPLRVEDVGDGKNERLLEPLRFYSARHRGVFVVQPGFVCDGASTPRVAWWLFPKHGRYRRSSWLHDAAYRGQLFAEREDGTLIRVRLIRRLADDLFLEAMESETGIDSAGFLAGIVRRFAGGAYKGVPDGQ